MPAMRLSSFVLAAVLAAASLSAETWDLSTIDNAAKTGQYASIGTRFGRTHVAYYDASKQDLKYAFTDDDKNWKIEIVDSNGDVGQYASIAVDLKGFPHISYYDATNHDLKYAVKIGTTWTINVVDAGFAGQFTSIAVDAEHRVYISYLDMANWDLKYAYGKAGNWFITLIDAAGPVGFGSSIALDAKEQIHISYNDDAANKVRYATNVGGVFSTTTLTPTSVAQPTAIAVDALGVVHIAILSNGLLVHLDNASGNFVPETVDEVGPEEYDLSMATTDDGRALITYYHPEKAELRLARKQQGGTWTIDHLDAGGTYNAVCIDKDGRIRIAHYGSDSLRFAIN